MVRHLSISSSPQSGKVQIALKLSTMVRRPKAVSIAETHRIAAMLVERPTGKWRRRRDTY